MDYKLLDACESSWHEAGLKAQAEGTFLAFRERFEKHLTVSSYFLKRDLKGFVMRLKGEMDEYQILHARRKGK